jgi:hypothetical protein
VTEPLPWPINPKIRRWLDRGDGVEALLGEGEYFVLDPGWGGHDVVLVVNQLFNWAELASRSEAAGSVLTEAVKQLVDKGDLSGAVTLIWAYVVIGDDRGLTLPIDASLLEASLDQAGVARLENLSEEFIWMVKGRLGALHRKHASAPST